MERCPRCSFPYKPEAPCIVCQQRDLEQRGWLEVHALRVALKVLIVDTTPFWELAVACFRNDRSVPLGIPDPPPGAGTAPAVRKEEEGWRMFQDAQRQYERRNRHTDARLEFFVMLSWGVSLGTVKKTIARARAKLRLVVHS